MCESDEAVRQIEDGVGEVKEEDCSQSNARAERYFYFQYVS